MHVMCTLNGTDALPPWVRRSMSLCTFTLQFSCIVAFIIPLITSEAPALNKDTGDMEADQEESEEHNATLIFIIVLWYVLLTFGHGGLVRMIVEIFAYVPPPGTWVDNSIRWVRMSVSFLAIILVYFFIQTEGRITGHSSAMLEGVTGGAARTMELGPVRCILVLAAHMRALQMDPTGPGTVRWAQTCFTHGFAHRHVQMVRVGHFMFLPVSVGPSVLARVIAGFCMRTLH